jgi:hypothetical protein
LYSTTEYLLARMCCGGDVASLLLFLEERNFQI